MASRALPAVPNPNEMRCAPDPVWMTTWPVATGASTAVTLRSGITVRCHSTQCSTWVRYSRRRCSPHRYDHSPSRRLSPVVILTLGRLLGHYGYLANRSGASAEALAALAESYALLADGDDLIGLGRTVHNQASAARWSGNYGEARRLLDRSLDLTTVTGDRHIRAMTLTNASNLAHSVGEYQEAERLFRAALSDWRELGNPRGAIWCITSCSVTLLALGKYQEAQQLLRESLALSHATNDRYGTATTLRSLGLAAFQQGDVEASIYFFREALPLLRSTGNWEYLHVLNDLGAALWQAGARGESRRTYGEALATALQVQAHHEALRAMIGIATHISHDGDHAAVLRLATRVLADPVSSDEVRRSAMELQRAAHAHLSVDEATRIEEQASALPLTAVLAELALPGIHR